MALLSKLPNDVLCDILDVLEHDTATLVTVAQVCSRLASLARPFIFRHLYAKDLSEDQQTVLDNVLAANPELEGFVWACDIRIRINYEGQAEISNQTSEYISRFPNLRQVDLIREALVRNSQSCDTTLCWKGWLCGNADCGKLEQPERPGEPIMIQHLPINLAQISTIHLDAHTQTDFSCTDIVQLMLQLPNLRHLRAGRLAAMGSPRFLEGSRRETSSLVSLELYGGAHWSWDPSDFHELLSFCPRLRELRTFMPILTMPLEQANHFTPYQSQLVKKLVSPAVFDWMLEPVRRTLRHLTFLDWRYDIGYDGSIMDFGQYPELEELCISSCCLLPPGKPGAERDELYMRLPRTLRFLELNFPAVSGVFYHWEEDEPSPPQWWLDTCVDMHENSAHHGNPSHRICRLYETQDEDGRPIGSDGGPIWKYERESELMSRNEGVESRSAWLYQFIDRKSTYFPNLRQVIMHEIDGPWDIKDWPLFNEKLCEDDKLAPFEAAGIDLTVRCKTRYLGAGDDNWMMQPNEFPGYQKKHSIGANTAAYFEQGWAPNMDVLRWLRFGGNMHASKSECGTRTERRKCRNATVR